MESSAAVNLQFEEAAPAGEVRRVHNSPPPSDLKAKQMYKFLERDLGCCRSFLVCFLWRIWQHLLVLKGHAHVITLSSFSEEQLNDWIEQAKYDSLQASAALVNHFGGIEPSETLPGCFWVSPSRFDPWWKLCKNPRSFDSLTRALCKIVSLECKVDNQREAFLLQVIALLTNIKSHDQLRKTDLGSKEIIQVHLPFPMPRRSIVSPYYYTHITIHKLQERLAEKKAGKAAASSSFKSSSRGRKRKRKADTDEDEDEDYEDYEAEESYEEPVYNMQEDGGVHEEEFEDLLDLNKEEEDNEEGEEEEVEDPDIMIEEPATNKAIGVKEEVEAQEEK
jgi:hypothetical protein